MALIKEFGISEKKWNEALKYLNYLNSVIDEQEEINSNGENVRINPFVNNDCICVLLDFIEKSVELHNQQSSILLK